MIVEINKSSFLNLMEINKIKETTFYLNNYKSLNPVNNFLHPHKITIQQQNLNPLQI